MSDRRSLIVPAAVAACAAMFSPLTRGQTVDGTVSTGEYGPPSALQNTPTSLSDNQTELDGAYVKPNSDGSFKLGLTGNLEAATGYGLVLFLDTRAGGAVSTVLPNGYGQLGSVAGGYFTHRASYWGSDIDAGAGVSAPTGGASIISPGFNPDLALEISQDGTNYYIDVIDMTLPNDPPASGPDNRDIFLTDPSNGSRSGVVDGAAVTSTYVRGLAGGGTLNAGTLTHAFNNTNAAGVNAYDFNTPPGPLGDPASASTGFEFLFSTLFLNADPGQEIKLLPFIANSEGDYLFNQFLPGLDGGTFASLGGPGGDGGTPLFDAQTFSNGANLYITVPLPEWGLAGGGSWSVDANWNIAKPDGVNATAKFGSAITAPALVEVDGPHTVGGIIFDNANSYTLGGSGTLTFDALPDKATRINVISGNHTVSAPMAWQKDMRLTVPAVATLTLSGDIAPAAGISLTKDGAGAVVMNNLRTDAVNIAEGLIRIAPQNTPNSAAGTSLTKSLSIAGTPAAPTARLDLTNNSAVIDYGDEAGTLVDDTRQYLRNGGIISSSADATRNLGYADNAVLGLTSFAGQSVDSTSLLIKYTYYGDTNLDGQVDVIDLGNLATSWQTSGVWINGDSNYDGVIDVIDLGLLATNWQAGAGSPLGPGSLDQALAAYGLPSVSVPEPASLGLIGLAGGLMLARRRQGKA